MPETDWFVYILKCGDGTLYTGITTDLDRRLEEHKKGVASKYTRSIGADKFVHTELAADRSAALTREAEIKKLSRQKKLQLISDKP